MAQSPVGFYPNDNAHNINIDTHLIIEFDHPVKAGSKGIVTVLDKTTNKVVDKIDMSIPAGPTEAQHANPDAIYTPPYLIFIRWRILPIVIHVRALHRVLPKKTSASIRRRL